MTGSPSTLHAAADHITEARQRARTVFSGESHLGDVDDWRQAIVAARDGIVFVWVFWVALYGLGFSGSVGPVLVCAGLGISVYLGVASGIATRLRLNHYESELQRERSEILENPDHERDEVLALYAAKGFQEPLLSQIADVLCADDDRLLKVMMEEELGLFIQHINHPLLVALWNASGAAAATLLLSIPACFSHRVADVVWLPIEAAALIAALGVASAAVARRSVVSVVASWLAVAAFAGGVTYFLAGTLAVQV